MNMRLLFALVLVGVVTAAGGVAAEQQGRLRLNDPVADGLHTQQTTLEDQTDVAVTVYNNDRALVRDRRKITFLPGESHLKFMDVAESIMPQTVSLRSLNDPGKLKILEQNFEYDLMSPQKLMEKYVGREVKLINKSEDYTFYEQKAILLSVNNGPVYEVDGEIYLGHPGEVVLPEIPEELIAKPTLVWLLSNDGADHEIEATYLTGNINWSADYVVTLNRTETAMDIEGWVTLNNRSGATYTNAELKLVAGELNLVDEGRAMGAKMMRADMVMAPSAPMMEQEAFAEYHLYTLQRRTTIRQNQSKQVSLLSGTEVPVEKRYEFRGNVNFYSSSISALRNQNADVFLYFQNREEDGMGMPLPAGVIRVYQEDRSGMLQFSGEDRIQHTPRNEEVRLTLGKAFDVVGDRIQTDYRSLGTRTHEAAFKIDLRNRKDTAITVDVVEPMPGDWTVVSESHPHEKRDARTAVFSLDIPADGEVELTYRIRVTY